MKNIIFLFKIFVSISLGIFIFILLKNEMYILFAKFFSIIFTFLIYYGLNCKYKD